MRVWRVGVCLLSAAGAKVDSSPPLLQLGVVEKFESETESLMGILIDSLYTDKDIFLREVLSNANDAIERDRVKRVPVKRDYGIWVLIDDKNDRLLIRDNGIGMCSAELKTQLGTVANSATRAFAQSQKEGGNVEDLIGRFGVGFYSTFLVADEVIVHSKCDGENKIFSWQSVDRSHYKILPSEIPTDDGLGVLDPSGTIVELKIKEELRAEYLQQARLKKIVNKFNKFISHPISIEHLSEEGSLLSRPETEAAVEAASIALWLKDPSSLTRDDYQKFYKENWNKKNEALGYIHFKAEGRDFSFGGILYIPKRTEGSNLAQDLEAIESTTGNFQFYVRKILINENKILPGYLNFIYGVIYSNDSGQLKVDRESLRNTSSMRRIKKKVLSKTYEMFKQLTPEEYDQFWRAYSQNLALGCVHETDQNTRQKILQLFKLPVIGNVGAGEANASSGDSHLEPLVRLDDYVKRYVVKGKQTRLFYYGGDLDQTPLFEIFDKHNVTILRAAGPFDEGCLNQNFQDYELHSIEKETCLNSEEILRFELANEDAAVDEKKLIEKKNQFDLDHAALTRMYDPLLKSMRAHLGHFVEVKISKRLIDSPFLVTVPEHGVTASYAKMLRTQVGGSTKELKDLLAKMKILEINARHPINLALLEIVKDSEKNKNPFVAEVTNVILQSAFISAGYEANEPHKLHKYLVTAIGHELNITTSRPLEDLDIPDEFYEEPAKDVDEDDEDSWNPADYGNDEL